MPTPIKMRVGVDWDNDGYINFDASPDDFSNMLPSSPLLAGVGLYYSDSGNVLKRTTAAYLNEPPKLSMTRPFTVGGVSRFSWGYAEGYDNANRLGNIQTIDTAIVPATMCIPVVSGVINYITVSFKVKQVSGSVAAALTPGFRYTLRTSAAAGTVASSSFGSAVSMSIGNWVTITHQVGIAVGLNTYIRIVPQAQFVYAANHGNGSEGTFEFKDLMVHAATGAAPSIPTGYNNGGTSAIYEDITPYVLDADWTLGNGDIKEKVPANGTAMIVLNNQSKMFLPNNTTSPLYGKMLPRRRVKIQMFNGTDWVDMWHGYVKAYKIVDGSPLEQRVRLECEQTVYSTGVENVIYTADDEAADPVVDSDFTEVMERLIQRNPLQNADLPIAWRIGASSLGVDNYLMEYALNIETHTAGVGLPTITNDPHNKYTYVGGNWEGRDLADVLRSVVNSEYGWVFYKRNGQLRGYDRYGWHLNLGIPTEVNMNNSVFSYVSSYGEDIRNSITVNWRNIYRALSVDLIPPNFKEDEEDDDDDEVVDKFWKRKKNIAVRGDKNMKTKIERIAYWMPTQEFMDENPMTDADGNPLTLNQLWARYSAGGPVPEGAKVFDFDPELHKVVKVYGDEYIFYPPISMPGALYHSVIRASDTPAGTEYIPTIYTTGVPRAWRSIWVVKEDGTMRYRWPNFQYLGSNTWTVNPIMMRASVNINEGEQSLTVRSSDSIMKYGGVFGWEIADSLYTVEEYAGCVAEQMLLDYANSGVGVSSFRMVTDDRSSNNFTTMMALEVGTQANLSEYYLGLSSAKHIVIQESHNVSNGVWEAEYTVVNLAYHATAQALANVANGL